MGIKARKTEQMRGYLRDIIYLGFDDPPSDEDMDAITDIMWGLPWKNYDVYRFWQAVGDAYEEVLERRSG